MEWLVVILGITLIGGGIVLWIVNTYNQIIVQDEMTKNAMGQIGVQQESRWDAVKSLMDATFFYQQNESEVLENIIERRTRLGKGSRVDEVEADDQALQQALHSIHVVVEQYPELKASGLYTKTMDAMTKYEDNVRFARMIFNDTVTKYNRLGKTFPNILIANMVGYQEKKYFEVSDKKKEAPLWTKSPKITID